MIPKDFFSPLSNNKIKKILFSCITIIILALLLKNTGNNKNHTNNIDIKKRSNNSEKVIDRIESIGSINNTESIDNPKSIDNTTKNNTTKVSDKNTSNKEIIDNTKPKPEITAEEYLVGNIETGSIYLSKNPNKVFPIASISKLITAVMAKNILNSTSTVIITNKMLEPYGDAGKLVIGEKYTIDELLYPLLLESSNDAAEAIAESYGYEDFMEKMNSIANELGMVSTSFKDPIGLSYENISNANDLFTLVKYAYYNQRPIFDITKKIDMTLSSTTDHIEHNYKNINPLASDPNFIGGKTGRTTEARESMISIFEYKIDNKAYPIAVIVLRSDFGERENDTRVLMRKLASKIDMN
jgi:D-alanyl-D-alanine carboxypeptidase